MAEVDAVVDGGTDVVTLLVGRREGTVVLAKPVEVIAVKVVEPTAAQKSRDAQYWPTAQQIEPHGDSPSEESQAGVGFWTNVEAAVVKVTSTKVVVTVVRMVLDKSRGYGRSVLQQTWCLRCWNWHTPPDSVCSLYMFRLSCNMTGLPRRK